MFGLEFFDLAYVFGVALLPWGLLLLFIVALGEPAHKAPKAQLYFRDAAGKLRLVDTLVVTLAAESPEAEPENPLIDSLTKE